MTYAFSTPYLSPLTRPSSFHSIVNGKPIYQTVSFSGEWTEYFTITETEDGGYHIRSEVSLFTTTVTLSDSRGGNSLLPGVNDVFGEGTGQSGGAAIVANVSDTVYGKGHSGLLIQRGDGTWQFISKEGRLEDRGGSSNNASSGGPALRAVDLNYKTLADFFSDKQHSRYNRFAMVSVSDVNIVESTMRQAASSSYHLLFANCGTAVNNALEAGGVNVGYFITPNSQFSAITTRNVINWYYER